MDKPRIPSDRSRIAMAFAFTAMCSSCTAADRARAAVSACTPTHPKIGGSHEQ